MGPLRRTEKIRLGILLSAALLLCAHSFAQTAPPPATPAPTPETPASTPAAPNPTPAPPATPAMPPETPAPATPSPATTTPAPETPPATSTEAAPAQQTPAATPAPDAAAAPDTPTPAAARPDAPSRPDAPPMPAQSLTLRMIDAKTGKPVPDKLATVEFGDGSPKSIVAFDRHGIGRLTTSAGSATLSLIAGPKKGKNPKEVPYHVCGPFGEPIPIATIVTQGFVPHNACGDEDLHLSAKPGELIYLIEPLAWYEPALQ